MTKKQTFETNVIKPFMFFTDNGQENRIISITDENNLDKIILSITNYIEENDGRFQPEEFKDLLYSNSKKMWEDYAVILRNVKLSVHLNKSQFDFLTNLILQELEYDVNTIFFAIELTNMLGEWSKDEDFSDEKAVKCFTSDATEITYIYHLIAKHKVKGLSDDSYRFAEVLRRIGEVTKVVSYYDNAAKSLAKDIQKWVTDFDPDPSVQGSVMSPLI